MIERGIVRYVSRSRLLRERKGWIDIGSLVPPNSVASRLLGNPCKFVEIEESSPRPSEEALALIAQLYRIEREIENKPPDMRLAIRQQRAGPVVQQIHQWALLQRALPQSLLGKVIAYLGKHFDGLRVCLTDPNVPLNNRAERALRGVVIGRKNHFVSRSERCTKVAAMMYSLVESAKINGVDLELYLKLAALQAERLSDHIVTRAQGNQGDSRVMRCTRVRGRVACFG